MIEGSPNVQPTARPEAPETARDRTAHLTASFYIPRGDLPESVQREIEEGFLRGPENPESLRQRQFAHAASRQLSQAIEPLFNDISDRERLGVVDDYMFAAGEDLDAIPIELSTPDEIVWTTEGCRFHCRPPGGGGARPARLRRFWTLHKNGALSWHVSMLFTYAHTPRDYYALSMLQKALAPKEFRPADDRPAPSGLHVHRPPAGGTGIYPLDTVTITDGAQGPAPFWSVIARWFETDVPVLFDRLSGGPAWRAKATDVLADPFGVLVRREPFLEAPDLQMPRFRYMFFFQDSEFFRRLLPVDRETRVAVPRSIMIQEPCYLPYLEKIGEVRVEGDGVDHVEMGEAYWSWVLERPDYAAERRTDPEGMAAAQVNIPAWEDDRRPDCLMYLFLAGFNQNIIDFMNQDASEIQDSTDPLYPSTDTQTDERFFVRFGSPRSLTSYVQRSRSLEAGNDYIGTCPYAFLIHVLALHNEFLARDYERSTLSLIDDVRQLNARGKLKAAAERFYDFRTNEYADYINHRYENVFRYDTEADVFSELEKRRGIERKTGYLNAIVSMLEKQTSDLQERLQKREDRFVTVALSVFGLFGFFQILLQLVELSEDGFPTDPVRLGLVWAGVAGTALVVAAAPILFLLARGDGRGPRRRRRRSR